MVAAVACLCGASLELGLLSAQERPLALAAAALAAAGGPREPLSWSRRWLLPEAF